MSKADEIWRDITGYEGLYQVSNLGRIKSLRCWTGRMYISREKILKPGIMKGYSQVQLCKGENRKLFLVHRIVAENFIPRLNEEQDVINHIDGNKQNNNVENLEWCTQKQNIQHAIKNKLFNPHKQVHSKKSSNSTKKPVLQFDMNGQLIRRWICIADIEKELGYRNSHITECCKGKIKTSQGYKWRYAEK